MARMNFPNTFAGVVKLFKAVKKKYDAEAGASKLQPFLDEDGIDMTADETAVDAAAAANTDFEKAEKTAEKQVAARNVLFDPTFVFLEGAVQSLKKLYRRNPHKLGDWAVTVHGANRIVYPPDFLARRLLVLAFIAKHQTFPPADSPLRPYLEENDIDIVQMKADATDALPLHEDFELQDGIKEQKRAERDGLIGPIEEHLRGEGQWLVNLFEKNPKKAGDWGFEVDDSPQADKIREGVIPAATSKVLRNLDVGKDFLNKGSTPLNLFPGASGTGTPIVLPAGKKFTVVRGFGIMTVVNPDNSQDGAYQGEFNQ